MKWPARAYVRRIAQSASREISGERQQTGYGQNFKATIIMSPNKYSTPGPDRVKRYVSDVRTPEHDKLDPNERLKKL